MTDEATIYNRHTTFNKRGKPAIIRIDAKCRNARIQISVEAVKILQLKAGDSLTFITLNKDLENIYFYVDNKEGIPLKVANEHKSGFDMGVYCRPLARRLLDHFGIREMRSFVVTAETTEVNGKKCFFINRYKTYSGKLKPNGQVLN